jgi:Tol biopolymer transport system component
VGPSAVAAGGFDGTTISWSPDGKQLAFDAENATVPSGCMENCTDWRVLVMNADGSGLRLVADAAKFPSWSGDGRRLAYFSGYSPGYGDYGGVTMTTLASAANVYIPAYNSGPTAGPAWSPQGGLIAVETQPSGSAPLRIETVTQKGGKPRKLVLGAQPTWSPSGARLAFIQNHRLYTIPAAGGLAKPLTPTLEHAAWPTWSPDGKWITYVRSTAKPAEGEQLAVIQPDRGGDRLLTHLTKGYLFDTPPTWTPDSKNIVFALGRPRRIA